VNEVVVFYEEIDGEHKRGETGWEFLMVGELLSVLGKGGGC